MELEQIWEEALKMIEEETSPVSFATWIQPIVPCGIIGNKIILQVKESFLKEIIEKRHLPLIRTAIKMVTKNEYDIMITTEEEQNAGNLHNLAAEKPAENELARNLNPKYVFDSFVVGNSNRMAHAASLAVAESPAQAYNPLFLYGNSGLGKTHLMHSIGHFILDRNPQAKVLYVTSETFTNELINSIQNNKNEEFRNKYRNIDVLMIDDIQFISKKEGTQEEFFHTFNTLYESKKQIVLTSDRPPRDIATLEDRLKTRFEWGLTADVQPPDFETRMAIIKRKAELVGLNVPDSVCEFIAVKLKSNIRQLEGTVKKLKAIHLVEGATPTINTAQRAISDIVNNDQPTPVTVGKIIEEVARTYGVSPEDIKSSKRNANISFARQISMYIVREITQMPMVEIGKEFGGRDHSTVVYAIQQIEEKSLKDPVTKATVGDIIKNIRDR